MPTAPMRLAFLFLAFASLSVFSHANCVDTILLKVKPVQCHGLRNGAIEVTEVVGDFFPFYFSLDGQNFSTRPVFDLLWAGEYILHVRDSTGCVKKFPVLVPEPEELRVKLGINDTAVVAGEIVQLKAQVFPQTSILKSIEWRPANLFPAQEQLTQVVKLIADTDLAVEIQNINDCISRDNLSVAVEQTNLYFPNVFRPGSSEDNYFTVFTGEGVSKIVYLRVFDRNGDLLYEGRNFLPNNPAHAWTGKAGDRMAPPGVYVWTASIEFLDGSQQQYSGNVTLME